MSDPTTALTVEWVTHVWFSCGCGSDRALPEPPVVGDLLWCYWHERDETVKEFRAVKQEVMVGRSAPSQETTPSEAVPDAV